jgi:DNA-binding response OmpR family regulator
MKVMVVNNDDLIHSQLKEFLIRADKSINIKKASSYKDALESFNNYSPDRVFLDLALYEEGIVRLLKRFKKQKPSVKVIFMVSSPSPLFKERCLKIGADDFFEKSTLKS